MTRSVLITGCSSGIGRAMALDFHARGYRVWATARQKEHLAALAEQGIHTAALDVNDNEQMQAVVSRIQSEQPIDLLINNAGYGGMGPLLETSGEELENQFATNVFAPMALARTVAPAMCDRGQGVIVNIGSVSGVLATPFSGSYCASKAALNTLSDVLRMELAPFGVQVVTVQPGAVRSRFADSATAVVDRVMTASSRYRPIEAGVRKRARASQQHPTDAEVFSRKLIDKLESGKVLTVVRLANGSTAYPLLKSLLPVALLEKVLGKMFMLNKL